jgi:Uma2 family endonuclease
MSIDVKTQAPHEPEPTWEIAHLFPPQGYWSEEEYLSLPTNRLVEFVDGRIEVLPMPKTSHQFIVQYLSNLLLAFVSRRQLGTVLFASLPVRLPPRTFREPDILFMLAENSHRIGEDFWEGADLVVCQFYFSDIHHPADLLAGGVFPREETRPWQTNAMLSS